MKHSPAARKGIILAVEQLLYSKVANIANIANICSHPVGNLGTHFGNLEKVMSSRSVEFGGGKRGHSPQFIPFSGRLMTSFGISLR